MDKKLLICDLLERLRFKDLSPLDFDFFLCCELHFEKFGTLPAGLLYHLLELSFIYKDEDNDII